MTRRQPKGKPPSPRITHVFTQPNIKLRPRDPLAVSSMRPVQEPDRFICITLVNHDQTESRFVAVERELLLAHPNKFFEEMEAAGLWPLPFVHDKTTFLRSMLAAKPAQIVTTRKNSQQWNTDDFSFEIDYSTLRKVHGE